VASNSEENIASDFFFVISFYGYEFSDGQGMPNAIIYPRSGFQIVFSDALRNGLIAGVY
jgi:hypothetical protein